MKDYIGDKVPAKYYIGETRVYKLFKGTALIWDSEVPSGLTVTYNAVTTDTPTPIANSISGFTSMRVDGGTPIAVSTGYTFATTGAHTIVWDLIEPKVPDSAFMHVGGNPIKVTSCLVGEGVTEIGSYAFFYSPLTAVGLPTSLAKIGDWAFGSCQYLTSVVLPSGLTAIGVNAFSNCMTLSSIEFPASLQKVGSGAFSQTGLKTVCLKNLIGGNSWYNTFTWCPSLTSVTFTADTTVHPSLPLEGTFQNCSNLREFIVPSGVYSHGVIVGSQIFTNCRNLQTVDFSDDTIIFGSSNFTGCTALTSVHVGKAIDTIGDNNFTGTPISTLQLPSSYIALEAINGMASLTAVTLGGAYYMDNKYITDLAFTYYEDKQFGVGCTALTFIHVLLDGELDSHQGELSSSNFSTDIPANGTIFYYYKAVGEEAISSKRIADALATLIGRGWSSVFGGYVS